MADPNNTYVAWDGERYEGQPPAGWYLAADNRWWPPQELIEGSDEPPRDPELDAYLETSAPVDPYVANPDDPFGPDPAHQNEYEQPAPPESWAPQSGTEARPPAPEHRLPQTRRPAGRPQASSPPRRKQGRFPVGFIIPMVIFGLLRCNADDPSAEFPVSDEPTVIFAEEEEAVFFETQTEVVVRGRQLPVTSDVPFYIEFNRCDSETIPVFLANDGLAGDFAVDLVFQPLDSSGGAIGEPFTISRIESLGQGEPTEPALAIPADLTPLEDCVLIDAAVTVQ